MTARVAADDAQAAREINSELTSLITAMQRGCEALDLKVIRDAAAKAKDICNMLTPAMQERVEGAVKLARSEARRLVKAGANAAVAVDRAVVDQLAFARSGFLDMDSASTIAAPHVSASDLDIEIAEGESAAALPSTSAAAGAAELDLEQDDRPFGAVTRDMPDMSAYDIVDDDSTDDDAE
jgi:hypothetical protein